MISTKSNLQHSFSLSLSSCVCVCIYIYTSTVLLFTSKGLLIAAAKDVQSTRDTY